MAVSVRVKCSKVLTASYQGTNYILPAGMTGTLDTYAGKDAAGDQVLVHFDAGLIANAGEQIQGPIRAKAHLADLTVIEVQES